jgi:hypothetical protein
MTALSQGPVTLGTVAAGLNTALTNVTVNAAHVLTAEMTAVALAGAPSGVVNVNGGVGTAALPAGATLNVTTGTAGYSALTVNSTGPGGATTNDLVLDTNAINTATITVAVASTEALTLSGTALNIDNLHTFTGTGTTVGLDVIFNETVALGAVVAATGGSGVNTFEAALGELSVRGQGRAGVDRARGSRPCRLVDAHRVDRTGGSLCSDGDDVADAGAQPVCGSGR